MKPQENVSFRLKTLCLGQKNSEKNICFPLKNNHFFLGKQKFASEFFCPWHNVSTQKEHINPEIFTFGKQFKCKREIQPEMDLYWNKNSRDLHAGNNQAEKKTLKNAYFGTLYIFVFQFLCCFRNGILIPKLI
jgi:hypothetical protein